MIHLYSMKNGAKSSINYFVGNYRARPFEKDFYEKLGSILDQYKESHPDVPMHRVSLILPDTIVITDTLTVPALGARAMNNSVDVLYQNSAEIKFTRQLAIQNKQSATFSILGVRRKILSRLKRTCSEHGVSIANITFASNAAVDGAFMLNTKIRSSSFVLLDIKDRSAKVIFVIKGKTLGFYSLPFGASILYKSRVAAEEFLADHSAAELVIDAAKAKAKAKAFVIDEDEEELEEADEVTISEAEAIEPNPDPDALDDELIEDIDEDDPDHVLASHAKKGLRKLPKFMQRPIPKTREEFVFENFRYFVKWVLNLIASNPGIVALGAPERVLVNMPSEYAFLYDMVNAEAAENGIEFAPLTESEVDENIRKNLELYGGFYAKQFNKKNNFTVGGLFGMKDDIDEDKD